MGQFENALQIEGQPCHMVWMFETRLSPEEKAALQRLAGGYLIDPQMLKNLVAKGLAEQLLGGNRVSAKGKKLLKASRL